MGWWETVPLNKANKTRLSSNDLQANKDRKFRQYGASLTIYTLTNLTTMLRSNDMAYHPRAHHWHFRPVILPLTYRPNICKSYKKRIYMRYSWVVFKGASVAWREHTPTKLAGLIESHTEGIVNIGSKYIFHYQIINVFCWLNVHDTSMIAICIPLTNID